jgi:hypothetical protein
MVMDIVERLKEDAAHHLDAAEYADGDPKNTINYRYYLNNFEAADEIERLREALRFYAKTDYLPTSDGPWGVDSDDFGNVARAALKEGE